MVMQWSWKRKHYKWWSYFVLILVFSGCGRAVRNTGAFEAQVQRFEADAAQFGNPVSINNIQIKFGNLSDSTLGLCTLGLDSPIITIDEKKWTNLNETQKELVFYHELGHCVLKKAHNDARLNNPGGRLMESIMNSHPLDLVDYVQFRSDYLTQLFDPSSGKGL